ncbi:hypothetical protein WA577_005051, partial [Blastocystis sp. JDR]
DEAPQGVEAIPPFLRSAVVVSATVVSCHLCSSNNDRSASNADGNASNADGKEMSEFVVRVCSKTGTWDVHRRYADFLVLMEAIERVAGREVFREVSLPPVRVETDFPPSKCLSL